MAIHDLPLFSLDDIRRGWDDACTRIIPLASIDPIGRAQIREYFIEVLFKRAVGDDGFPEEPQPINADTDKTKEGE